MLEQLFDLVKGQVGEQLKNDNDFNGDHNAVSQVASESILSNLADLAKGGNFAGIAELFNGQETDANHEVVNQLQPNIANSLMDKLGLDSSSAQSLVMKVLPFVLNMFNDKVRNQQGGAGGLDIANIISNIAGGNQNAGGITDIISTLIGGQNQAQQQQSTGGGIFNIIKGLFGGRR